MNQPTNPLAGLDQIDGIEANDVELEARFDGSEGLRVQEVSIQDGLNRLPMCTVRLAGLGFFPNLHDLLRKDCEVEIHRPGEKRHFRGVIWQARVHEVQEGFELILEVATAAQLLTQIVDSYIYQDKSVPEIVKSIYERYLGPTQRRADNSFLQRTYPTREYVVQYQETVYEFMARLCEEEGIFFFFDHDVEGDTHEVLVLADTSRGLPKARASHGGRVPYNGHAEPPPGEEVVSHVEHREEVGATDVVIRDYDWTRPDLRLEKDRVGRGRSDPALEVYDHADPIHVHDYQEPQYQDGDAAAQADIRAELLDLSRQSWSLETTVVTAQAGYLLNLTGAPEPKLDGEYLIVSASCSGHIVTGGRGVWSSSLTAVPSWMPYRPSRRTPRPVVHGPETAVVVGPAGEDIHTDVHGRVKVQFHWDRQHQRSDESSCWLRVAHNWAGAGFGAFFLPRVGMEVVVSFLGGNPDRPLVTGCVYNGNNHVPHLQLPQEKTQTVIRTNSSGPSGPGTGYNEFRFEDLDGSEFISVHAQRDLREKVLRNRTTQVHNDDRLTVTRNSYIKIRGTEEHWVTKNARWSYPSQVEYRLNRRRTSVGFATNGEGPGDYYLNCAERVTAFGNSASAAAWKDISDSDGRYTNFAADASWGMELEDGTFHLKAKNDPPTQLKFDAAAGTVDTGASARVMMVAGASLDSCSGVKIEPDKVGVLSPGRIKIETQSGASSIEVSDAAITLKIGGTEVTLTPAGVITNAPVFIVAGGFISRGGNVLWD